MEFTDLQENHPKDQDIYTVKVKDINTGKVREIASLWNGKGFDETNIARNEYIIAWQ